MLENKQKKKTTLDKVTAVRSKVCICNLTTSNKNKGTGLNHVRKSFSSFNIHKPTLRQVSNYFILLFLSSSLVKGTRVCITLGYHISPKMNIDFLILLQPRLLTKRILCTLPCVYTYIQRAE